MQSLLHVLRRVIAGTGALTDIGYDGYTCIEVEDRAFEGTKEKGLDSLPLSKRYMEQFVI